MDGSILCAVLLKVDRVLCCSILFHNKLIDHCNSLRIHR